MTASKQTEGTDASAQDGLGFRSSAVARMARMPVATLRIWEQRYQAVNPASTGSGHRLYSPADVQRVLLLRQLTEQGHAISTLAALDAGQLQQVAEQASLASSDRAEITDRRPAHKRSIPRLAVVGSALATRLQRPAVVQHLTHVAQRVVVFESLSEAMRSGIRADLLLWHVSDLRPELPPELHAAQQACRAQRMAVVYRFAATATTRALTDAGVAILREPADDHALGIWLASIEAGVCGRVPEVPECETPASASVAHEVPPRRYDDATLTAIAGRSSTLACECPQHVAELLLQLASFEAYSAGCVNRDSVDAQLHAYLQQVAGASRALFEAAFERVARHEGLPLP